MATSNSIVAERRDASEGRKLIQVSRFRDGFLVLREGPDGEQEERPTFKQEEELVMDERQFAQDAGLLSARPGPHLHVVDGGPEPDSDRLEARIIDFDRLPDPALSMPAALERSDGGLILYRQRVNWLSAAQGQGKTWVALLATRYLLGQGVRVAWLDHDNGTGEDLADRAPSLGMAAMIRDRISFWCLPGEAVTADTRWELREWLLGGPDDGFVVLDSVTSAGCPIDGDPREWLTDHIDPYQRAGIGVLALDHISYQPHGGPTGWRIKGATLNGVMLRASGRCWDRHNDGHIDLAIDGKDRAGRVANTDRKVARIRGTWQDGALGVEAGPPNDTTVRDPRDSHSRIVLDYIREHPGTTNAQIADALGMPRTTVSGYLRDLNGQITRERQGREVRLSPRTERLSAAREVTQ